MLTSLNCCHQQSYYLQKKLKMFTRRERHSSGWRCFSSHTYGVHCTVALGHLRFDCDAKAVHPHCLPRNVSWLSCDGCAQLPSIIIISCTLKGSTQKSVRNIERTIYHILFRAHFPGIGRNIATVDDCIFGYFKRIWWQQIVRVRKGLDVHTYVYTCICVSAIFYNKLWHSCVVLVCTI